MKNMESALYSHDFTNARATNIQILDDIWTKAKQLIYFILIIKMYNKYTQKKKPHSSVLPLYYQHDS
jgi:hypothetical protein